jgi:MoaA/NifB/PqqE/SkfB family radical SAM enzyme
MNLTNPHHFVYKLPRYFLSYRFGYKPPLPFCLTFSVTNICQSRCRTCKIWDIYRQNPDLKNQELSLDEIEQIFASMGPVYIFNVSGGEPFLRPDFTEIIALAVKYLKPGIIHIPTNAIAGRKIVTSLEKIIAILKAQAPDTRLTIKPSLDHVYEKHDAIRGVKGNFEKVLAVFQALQDLKTEYPPLSAELGTVISRWNINDIDEISSFALSLNPDSYRNEIAEERSEMFNFDDHITPDHQAYQKAIQTFSSHQLQKMNQKPLFHRVTNAFRLVYYQLALEILHQKTQPIPCYAGITNAHLTPYGDVWACCTLGYTRSMGNLKDAGYDFRSVWHSPKADQVRKQIKNKECVCPLANQMYSNLLMDTGSVLKVMALILGKKSNMEIT